MRSSTRPRRACSAWPTAWRAGPATAALGLTPSHATACPAAVDVRTLRLRPGQTLLIVSDGVSAYLDRARLAAIVAERGRTARGLADALVASAMKAQERAGTGDNVS